MYNAKFIVYTEKLYLLVHYVIYFTLLSSSDLNIVDSVLSQNGYPSPRSYSSLGEKVTKYAKTHIFRR